MPEGPQLACGAWHGHSNGACGVVAAMLCWAVLGLCLASACASLLCNHSRFLNALVCKEFQGLSSHVPARPRSLGCSLGESFRFPHIMRKYNFRLPLPTRRSSSGVPPAAVCRCLIPASALC